MQTLKDHNKQKYGIIYIKKNFEILDIGSVFYVKSQFSHMQKFRSKVYVNGKILSFKDVDYVEVCTDKDSYPLLECGNLKGFIMMYQPHLRYLIKTHTK